MTVCPICGNEVDQSGARNPRLYCSKKCFNIARRAYNTEYQRKRRAKLTDDQKAQVAVSQRLAIEKKAWELWAHEAGVILDLIEQAPIEQRKIVLARYMVGMYRPVDPGGMKMSFTQLPEAIKATDLLKTIDIKLKPC